MVQQADGYKIVETEKENVCERPLRVSLNTEHHTSIQWAHQLFFSFSPKLILFHAAVHSE